MMKRITISLDDELYAMARGHAAATHISVSKAIMDGNVLLALLLGSHVHHHDSWLAELARRKQGRLATLDEGLAALWPDVATLLPVV